MAILIKKKYFIENINNTEENGNIAFNEDEVDFVLTKTFEELDVVFTSLGEQIYD